MTTIENSVLIDAPLDLVWEMTNDITTWPTLFSEYESVEVLEVRDNTITFRLVLRPDENDKRWSWVSERTPDKTSHSVTAHRIETGPFTYMNIRWNYQETSSGVRMRWEQDFAVRPELPFNDTDMATKLTTNTRREMTRIKNIVEDAARNALITT